MFGNTLFTILTIFVAALYFVSGTIIWRRLFLESPVVRVFTLEVILVIAAMIIHGILLYTVVLAPSLPGLTLAQAASAISWIAVVLFVILTFYKRLHNLGVFILPLAGVCLLLTLLWSGQTKALSAPSVMATLHLLVALLAYGFLAMAVAQALLLQFQENQLRQRRQRQQMTGMPAVESMENTMFALIAAGFLLLTVALASGAMFSEQLYGRPLVFNHHIVLSLCAWFSFGTLLVGRYLRGWRGQRATLWTCAGFGILVLAYFGTRLVLEVILQHNV